MELKLTDNIYKLVIDYSEKHKQFNTFIIKAVPKQTINNETIESGFFIGPGYKDILNDYKLTMYCDIKDKRVYYISDMSKLFDIKTKDTWNNINASDSIILSDDQNIIIRDADALFINRAIFFNFDDNGNLEVNYKPDTIFAPKYLETTIKFENIKDTVPPR